MPYKCTFCYVVLDLICLRCNLSPRRGPLQNYRSFFEHTQQMPRDRCSVCIKLHALDPFAQLTMLLSKSRPIEGFFNAFPPAYEVLVPCVVLVLIWLATTLSTLRPAIELPRVRTLSQVLEKIQAVRAFDFVLFLRSVPNWKKEFLAPSMSRSSAAAFNIVCHLDRNGKFEEVSQDKKQKLATSLFRDELHLQDFAGPISSRASKVLGLISRCRIAGILLT